MRQQSEKLTQRELDEFEQEKEVAKLQAEYQLKFKTLELEIKKIETRWSQIFRIPMAIILLPVRLLMAIAFISSTITKKELPQEYWDFMSR